VKLKVAWRRELSKHIWLMAGTVLLLGLGGCANQTVSQPKSTEPSTEPTCQSAQACFELGKSFDRNKEWDQAISSYSQSIALDPKNVQAYHARGRAFAGKIQWDKAIADYSQMVVLNPQDVAGYYSRSFAFRKKGELDKAIVDQTKAISLNQDSVRDYDDRGFITFVKAGGWKEAVSEYNQAIALNPQDANVYAKRAAFFWLNDRWDESISDYATFSACPR
jgi:tetratricopeptide (TPR) repeat protein